MKILAFFMSTALITNAQATNGLFFASQPGEFIGAGLTRTFTDSDGTFSATSTGISFIGTKDKWTVSLLAPGGKPLATGIYPNALHAEVSDPSFPGIYVSANGRECKEAKGTFAVSEVAYDSNSKVTALAADFLQYCDGSTRPLHGAIRFNSNVPINPTVYSSPTLETPNSVEGDLVSLSADKSFGTQTSISTFQWAQVSGPTVILTDDSASNTKFRAPAVKVGGEDVVLNLTVKDAQGHASTTPITIPISSRSDIQTYMSFISETGDPVGKGLTKTFLPADWKIDAFRNGLNGVTIKFDNGINWTLDFANASRTDLTPGIFTAAQRYPFVEGVNTLNLAGEHRVCSDLNGSFQIHSISYAGSKPDAKVSQFSADFEQTCVGTKKKLSGKIRINTPPPAGTSVPGVTPPTSDAGIDQIVVTGRTVILNGKGSHAGSAPLDKFEWSQVAGTPVGIQGSNTETASFYAFNNKNTDEVLTFKLTVRDKDGYSSSKSVNVTIRPLSSITPATFSSTATLINGRLSLKANAKVSSIDVGSTGNIYIAALASDMLWAYDGKNWAPFAGTNQAPAQTTTLQESTSIPLLDNIDPSQYTGVVLFMGYGVSIYDVIQNRRFGEIFRF
ncbi:hypothetical protein [Chitinimonas sp.]|uniref:PKD domain-containing protein n=1 Tax=Chitinimonas sp. TaxID=1934313 RepID=UPI0035AE4321